jgi:hypothetical protein
MKDATVRDPSACMAGVDARTSYTESMDGFPPHCPPFAPIRHKPRCDPIMPNRASKEQNGKKAVDLKADGVGAVGTGERHVGWGDGDG